MAKHHMHAVLNTIRHLLHCKSLQHSCSEAARACAQIAPYAAQEPPGVRTRAML